MTALINDLAAPQPLWAVTRYLLGARGRRDRTARAQALLSPASLFETGIDTQKTFSVNVKVAKELGVIVETGEYLSLSDRASELDADDVESFHDLLRDSILHRVPVDVLATDTSSNTEGKDLLRSLCFFMTLDLEKWVDLNTFSRVQAGALSEEFAKPFQNSTRWNFFTAWAEALGFAASPLVYDARAVALVPDCRKAIRRTARRKWPVGTTLQPQQLISGLLEELPVLPGGAYSKALGFDVPQDGASEALSVALLAGDDDGWLSLSARADASDALLLWDPPDGRRRVSSAELKEAV